jgi:cysteine desulfurase/selenocysteine lyase
VQRIGCDFYAFSGHKMFGPTGIGVLYGNEKLLEAMPPYQGGGDMIATVSFKKSTWNDLPYKFEAGTPNIADVIGLGAAIDYLDKTNFANLGFYEHGLLRYAEAALQTVPGLRLIGTANSKGSVISFVMEDPPISSMDIGAHLDRHGVAIRTGHHCCMPLMEQMNIPSTARASFAFYNTTEEVDRMVLALRELQAAAKKATVAQAPAPAKTTATLTWPEPFSASPRAAADELAETLDYLGSWEEKDQFILELGEKLPPMPDSLKLEPCRVQGCMSTVHMVGRLRPGTTDTLDILADSDAHLVRGLIGLLQHLYSGQKADDILAFDVKEFLHRVGLDGHLSMGRRSGLEGMIKRIRTMARSLKETHTIPAEFSA